MTGAFYQGYLAGRETPIDTVWCVLPEHLRPLPAARYLNLRDASFEKCWKVMAKHCKNKEAKKSAKTRQIAARDTRARARAAAR